MNEAVIFRPFISARVPVIFPDSSTDSSNPLKEGRKYLRSVLLISDF